MVKVSERDILIKNLQKRTMRITFTKVNGDERVMDCTLQENLVPATKYTNRKQNEEVLPVFDINKGVDNAINKLDKKSDPKTTNDNDYPKVVTEYYSSGQKWWEGKISGKNNFGNEIKDGLWTEWDENGQKMSEITYKDDFPV